MDIRSNEPYWLIKNELTNSYPSLDESITTNTLIIGGGITGALIAYKLINEGKEITLVDRRDVCNGSSAASTAMLQYEIDMPLHRLIEMRGEKVAVDSYRQCEKAIFDLKNIIDKIKSDCNFEFKKSIYFSSSRKDNKILEEEFETRKKYGFGVKWLDKTALKNLGLKAFCGIESVSGAVMDPYKLSNDLLNYCNKKGVRIFDRTEIESIEQKDNLLIAHTPGKIKIEASNIIHCTGYESVRFIHKNFVALKSTYAMASEAFTELPVGFKNHIYWNTSNPYVYLRTSENRIIIGGGDVDFKNAKRRDALLHKKEKSLLKKFHKFFPDVKFKSDYIWAGTFGETEDGLPYIGKPEAERNEHFVLGFGGNGITYSVMAMDAIMASLENKPHDYLNYYHFDR